jgi:ABC-2 type transport system permease protein
MIKLWSIARNTFLQTIRQPIYLVMILLTFALLVFTLPFSGYTMSVDYHEADQEMLQELGLAALRISGLLIAAFSASGVLRREIEEKTALIVIAKPVSRTIFVLGKFAGVAAAVAVAYYLCSLVFLMTVRHQVVPAASDKIDWPVVVLGLSGLGLVILIAMLGNLWFGWQFTSAGVWSAMILLTAAMAAIAVVGKGWTLVPFGKGIPPQLLLEMAMMFMAVIIFVALAVLASTRLGQAMTLLVCTAVFVLGSAHSQVFSRWGQELPLARVLGWAVPDFSQFYPQDDLRLDQGIPLLLVATAGLYCLLYTTGLLAVAVGLFETRELEAAGSSAAAPTLVGMLAWIGRIAAVLAGFAGLAILSLPRLYTLSGLLTAGGLLAAAVGGWLLWGAFGYGRRWSYRAVQALAALGLVACVALLISPRLLPRHELAGPVLVGTATVLAAAVGLILLLPSTRRHFQAGGR